jgi:hypothetical protein
MIHERFSLFDFLKPIGLNGDEKSVISDPKLGKLRSVSLMCNNLELFHAYEVWSMASSKIASKFLPLRTKLLPDVFK